MSPSDYLFSDNHLQAHCKQRVDAMIAEIDGFDPQYVLDADADALIDHLEQKYSLECPCLQPDRAAVDHTEVMIDVSQDPLRHIRDRSGPFYMRGTAVSLFVPFEGDSGLFRLQPSTSTFNPPRGVVKGDQLVLRVETLEPDSAKMKAGFDRELSSISQYLGWVGRDVQTFNSGLRSAAQAGIASRRAKLVADQELVSSLGFPLRERADSVRTYAVPEVRRRAVGKPPAAGPVNPAEPALANQVYDHILSVVRSMVHVMERSPGAFSKMKEEHLRDHFLVQLNGHYEGQATGETFNASGKTDILIRVRDRNIFIAECKFWKGPVALAQAIDQLLDYTSWRDTKTALILFNRNKQLSNVLAQIPDVARGHACFVREQERTLETEFRCVLHHRDDKGRELILTIMVFEVPL